MPVRRAVARDHKWIEPLAAELAASPALGTVCLDIQGMHCSACVWLVRELFERQPEHGGVQINPALGTVNVVARRGFDLEKFVTDVEAFGYVMGPPLKSRRSSEAGSSLLLRMGICVALTMNAMVFALAVYLGLDRGPTFDLMVAAGYGLSAVAVLVGGSVFFASAWRALRRGVLHMDAPIALGIALSFAGATWSFLWGDKHAAYFDTITTFITLMLVGRWLQERVLESNRRRLLEDDGADSLYARRIANERIETVRANLLRRGDVLLIASGDLIPVDSVLSDASALVSTDWISGESDSRPIVCGARIAAGSFNAGTTPVRVVAATDMSDSSLLSLLRSPVERNDAPARASAWWQTLARAYVWAVIVLAGAGALVWWMITHDLHRTLDVTTAILVVTCPCALGIATPLAYEFVQAGLRRGGLFVRTASFLDRARTVSRVVFDKTGTVTSGALAIVNPDAIRAMHDEQRDVLYTLAAQSTHPKSCAIVEALRPYEVRMLADACVQELAGKGVVVRWGTRSAALGSSRWLGQAAADDDLMFAIDDVPVATFRTQEVLRPDAAEEVAALGREGYDLWLVSGDAKSRVDAAAQILHLRADHALAECTPTGKAAWLAEHDRNDTLMVGDGINDSLAVSSAWCSGTPAIDRPFMPARSDFYFTTAGIRPIRTALAAARRLHSVTSRNLAFAVLYNVFAVALCFAGVMRPWLAAVLMPASSLCVIALTTLALGRRSSVWK